MQKHATIIGYIALSCVFGFIMALIVTGIAKYGFQLNAEAINNWGNSTFVGFSASAFYRIIYERWRT